MTHFHIVTLFPEAFQSYINTSILGRALKNKRIAVSFYNPRDFTDDPRHRVDRKPYSGGPGMVIEAQPVIKAVEKAIGRKKDVKVIFFSTDGKEFTNTYAKTIAKKHKHIVLISGHYEGVDERVRLICKAQLISIGPYILTGGELPAMVVIDSVSRHVEGVLGNSDSIEESRTSTSIVYTRPEKFVYKGKTYKVPKVLLSGHHKDIESWKESKQKRRKS